MSVDDNLLKLNQDIDNNSQENYQNNRPKEANEAGDIRADRRAAIIKRAAKEREKKEKANKLTAKQNPMKKFSARLLRSSWMNLLPTFGLSILGVAANVILRVIFGPKFFCRLGDEWGQLTGHDKLQEQLKGKTKMINLVETMGFALAIILLFLSFLAILSLVAMIVGFVKEPLVALKDILKDFFPLWKDN